MRRRLKEQIRDQQKDTQRQFHDKAFDESKNRSMTSVSTLQELGSQMMEFYNDSMQGHMIPRDKLCNRCVDNSSSHSSCGQLSRAHARTTTAQPLNAYR